MFFTTRLGVLVVCLVACDARVVLVPELVEPAPILDSVLTCTQASATPATLVLPSEPVKVSRISCRARNRATIRSLRILATARLHTGEYVDALSSEISRIVLLKNGTTVAIAEPLDEEGYARFTFAELTEVVEGHEEQWDVQVEFNRTRRALVYYTFLFWPSENTVSSPDAVVGGEKIATPSVTVGLTNAYPVITKSVGTPAGAVRAGGDVELARIELSHRGRDIVLDPIIRVCLRSSNIGLLDIVLNSAFQVFGSVRLSRNECGDIAIAPYEVDVLPDTFYLTAVLRPYESLNVVIRPRATVWKAGNGEEVNGVPGAPHEIVFPGLVAVP